jgi:hypothetical protein
LQLCDLPSQLRGVLRGRAPRRLRLHQLLGQLLTLLLLPLQKLQRSVGLRLLGITTAAVRQSFQHKKTTQHEAEDDGSSDGLIPPALGSSCAPAPALSPVWRPAEMPPSRPLHWFAGAVSAAGECTKRRVTRSASREIAHSGPAHGQRRRTAAECATASKWCFCSSVAQSSCQALVALAVESCRSDSCCLSAEASFFHRVVSFSRYLSIGWDPHGMSTPCTGGGWGAPIPAATRACTRTRAALPPPAPPPCAIPCPSASRPCTTVRCPFARTRARAGGRGAASRCRPRH